MLHQILYLPKGGGIAEFAPWFPAEVGCWWRGPPYKVPNGFPAVELINLSPFKWLGCLKKRVTKLGDVDGKLRVLSVNL